MKKAFTLIELLVVIAIIALLLSILMPALNRVKVQARNMLCMSNMRQQNIIFNLYAQDNGSKYPIRGSGWPTFVKMLGNLKEQAWVSLDPYIEDPWITICPALASYKMDAGDIFKDPYASWGSFGAWASEDPMVSMTVIGYAWFLNVVSPDHVTAIWEHNEEPWPNRQEDCTSSSALAAHNLVFQPAYQRHEDWGHEASSKGRIFDNHNDSPDVFTSQNAPVLFGDGSVISRSKGQFRKRAEVTVSSTISYYYY